MLKILVPLKRVIDFTVKIKVRPEAAAVDKKTAKMSMNPFCEVAIEEAVRLKEKKKASEIIAVTIGNKKCNDQLRTAMAMGCDRSIHILTEMETDTELQPLAVSRILCKLIEKEKPNLVIMGKQAIDDDCGQTGQMIAGRLNWPQATYASKLDIIDNETVEVLREIDGGGERVRLKLPSVVTVDLRLNEPRFASLQNIMKAKKQPIQEIKIEEFGVDMKPHILIQKMEEPPIRKGGVFVESVEDLFNKLKSSGAI